MKFRNILQIIIFFPFISLCVGQTKKIILDHTTRLPLSFVYIFSADKKTNLVSNTEGYFFYIKEPKSKEFTFYKIGYEVLFLPSEKLALADTFFLHQKSIELTEVSVTVKKIEPIVKDKRFYVDDYMALSNSDFLVITSKINVKGFELSYYKKDKGITCTKKITSEINAELNKDCFKNYHLLTSEFSRQLIFTSDSTFDFLPKYTRLKFDSTIGIVALKIDSTILVKKQDKTNIVRSKHFSMKLPGQSLNYYKLYKNKADFFYNIEYNAYLKNMINNELNYWEMACFISNPSTSINVALKGIQTFENLIAKKIYAPVYLQNDTVIVFNFQEETIVLLDKIGKELNKIKMNKEEFILARDYSIIYDQPKQKFYFKTRGFDRTTLSQLNILTGRFTKTIKFEKAFVKNVQILNDRIYYLVKENQWDDTKYLYEQNY